MINWNYLSQGMPNEIKRICIDSQELESLLDSTLFVCEMGANPSTSDLIRIEVLAEKIWRELLATAKGAETNPMVEKKFKAFHNEVSEFRFKIKEGAIKGKPKKIANYLSIFQTILTSIVHPSIERTKERLRNEAPRALKTSVLERIGITRLPEEEKGREREGR